MERKHQFQIGDVIHHRRYDYRGVIVQVDEACQAGQQWYQSNQTQPARDQPWYHVLVHGSDHTTYVAQENLEADTTEEAVEHPLLKRLFSSFFQGRYYKDPLN